MCKNLFGGAPNFFFFSFLSQDFDLSIFKYLVLNFLDAKLILLFVTVQGS